MKHDPDPQQIDAYIDQRLHNPSASPPAELDAETAHTIDVLMAAERPATLSQAARGRIWRGALDSAKPTQVNGHIQEDAMQATIPQPKQRRSTSSRASRWLLPLAAVFIALVMGAFWFNRAPSPITSLALASDTPTPAPTATATPSPTETACIRHVEVGDTLLSLMLDCGHHDPDVIHMIVATNNLSSSSTLQIGQELMIPWPTPIAVPPAMTFYRTDDRDEWYLIDGDVLEGRYGPGADYDAAGRLYPGDFVNVIARSPDGAWLSIRKLTRAVLWIPASAVTFVEDKTEDAAFVVSTDIGYYLRMGNYPRLDAACTVRLTDTTALLHDEPRADSQSMPLADASSDLEMTVMWVATRGDTPWYFVEAETGKTQYYGWLPSTAVEPVGGPCGAGMSIALPSMLDADTCYVRPSSPDDGLPIWESPHTSQAPSHWYGRVFLQVTETYHREEDDTYWYHVVPIQSDNGDGIDGWVRADEASSYFVDCSPPTP
ncbi:MAG: hypothetical protein IT320_18605 [Anaerolineae bacterium]|nr:hypothetical protein [Anaerolineae bacterium]